LSETLDAIVTAGARLPPALASRVGTDVKALARIGGRTLLEIAVEALAGTAGVARTIVVAPRSARSCGVRPDVWIDEFANGHENLLAALGAVRTPRALFAASDLPFLTSRAVLDFVARVPAQAAGAYPIFERGEFEAAFPNARSKFVRLADGCWTGGSVMLLEPRALLARASLVRRAFDARKNPLGLAALLGMRFAVKFLVGQARVGDVERRAAQLMGDPIAAIRGADPSLAMDCDEACEFDYAIERASA